MARAKGVKVLPHGAVNVANIKDDATREALRKLSENQIAIERVLIEMKRGGV